MKTEAWRPLSDDMQGDVMFEVLAPYGPCSGSTSAVGSAPHHLASYLLCRAFPVHTQDVRPRVRAVQGCVGGRQQLLLLWGPLPV